jgi:methionyl-tRNA formyltransferase
LIRILYAGSPEPAAVVLRHLLERSGNGSGYEVVGVLSNPPSAQGRHKTLIPTPVAALAEQAGVPVFTPEHLDASCREQVAAVRPDLLICFAYGHIFGPKFLALFKLGALNVHPSLLPKYRGCTPVPAALLNQDSETGVSVQRLALEMDAGDIVGCTKIALDGTETAGALLLRSAETGADLLAGILATAVQTGELPPGIPQSGEPSYTKMITKEDGHIDWSLPSAAIYARIRAYTPSPGCWTVCRGVTLRILQAAPADKSGCPEAAGAASAAAGTVVWYDKKRGILVRTGDGFLCVTELQWQAKKAMGYKDFMNGCRDFVGSVLE